MTTTEYKWPEIEPAPTPYVHRGTVLPNNLRESLDEYARHGCPTGGFLSAVLCNDLQDAIALADDESLRALPSIVAYVYNCLPSTCWGGAEKVRNHIDTWLPRYRESLQ